MHPTPASLRFLDRYGTAVVTVQPCQILQTTKPAIRIGESVGTRTKKALGFFSLPPKMAGRASCRPERVWRRSGDGCEWFGTRWLMGLKVRSVN
jgi:hypothetical protein